MRRWWLLCLLGGLGFVACGGEEATEDEDGEFDVGLPPEKADWTFTECQGQQILVFVNDPTTTNAMLKSVGVASRARTNMLKHRDGPDGSPGTGDDDLFDTLEELDAISYVGPKTIEKLAAAVDERCVTTSPPEVIFSPQPPSNSHLTKIVKLIDSAQNSIDIAVYSFSDTGILDALKRAIARGIKVRLIFEPARDQASSPAGTASAKYEDAGIDVRYVNKIMHHKFGLIDGPRDTAAAASTGVLITGSGNWSNSAATRYDENTVFITGNSELLLRFQKEFNLLWENSRDLAWNPALTFFASLPITDAMIVDDANVDAVYTSANFQVTSSSRGPTFSVVSGRNTAADRLVQLIQGATHSIHIASGHLRSRPVAEALMAKAAADPTMDIRVILDNQEYISKSYHDQQVSDLTTCLAAAGESLSKQQACTDTGFLFSYAVHSAGIPLRYKVYCYRWDMAYALQLHHKYMVFDGQILASGSYNLSDNAEHATMENVVVYHAAEYPALVQSFEDNFSRLWTTGEAEGRYQRMLDRMNTTTDPIPLVFDPVALTWDQFTTLKQEIRSHCPAVDTDAYRTDPVSHQVCYR